LRASFISQALRKYFMQSIKTLPRTPRASIIPLIVAFVGASLLSCAAPEDRVEFSEPHGSGMDGGGQLEYHGIAAPVLRSRGAAAMAGADGERLIVVQLMEDRGCLVINVENGSTARVRPPFETWDSPYAFHRSEENRLYTAFGGHFLEFDPETMDYTFTRRVDSQAAMSIIEGSDGRIYAAFYPDSRVIAFDPSSRQIQDYGRVKNVDWQQYVRSMVEGADGWIYMGIGNVYGAIAALNPVTGEKKVYPDPKGEQAGAARLRYGLRDGRVYGMYASDKNTWFQLEDGLMTQIDALPGPTRPAAPPDQESIESGFQDGSELALLDLPERFALIGKPDGSSIPLNFDYPVKKGPDVYSTVAGPGGKIYGSTGHPLRIYQFNPEDGSFEHHGVEGMNGHWNAITRMGDMLYGAQYGPAIFWRYDPERPWRPESPSDPNPQRLVVMSPEIGRPHAIVGLPSADKVVVAGTPGYGRTGGGLMVFDASNSERSIISHEALIPTHSTTSLAALDHQRLVGGTTRRPGTGGVEAVTDAQIYIFDLNTEVVEWADRPLESAYEISDLLVGGDGLVHGLATLDEPNGAAHSFVFDPTEKRVLSHTPIPESLGGLALSQSKRMMVLAGDGSVYGLFSKGIGRLSADSSSFEPVFLFSESEEWPSGAAPWGHCELLDGKLYFSVGSKIWSYRLPLSVNKKSHSD
jgi:hypothetical protein